MGYEAIIYGVILLGMVVLTYYTMTHQPSLKGQDMKPATLDAFAITYCEEGTVVPLVYGTVRLPGNMLWYGNLRTEANVVRGPGQPVDGYWYWLDVWQSIGIGLLEIVGMYVADKVAVMTDSYTYTPGAAPVFGITRTLTEDGRSQTITYNPGDSAYVPAGPGENAAAMNPVCHVFASQWLMPKSSTYMPTIHWVVKHRFPSWFPITGAEMANGDNPAAIIYDLLLKAGETSFNLASFQTAADYWTSKGYGINISFSQQGEAKELITQVFNYVDGLLRQQADGAWELLAFTDTDASVESIETEDFVEFVINRSAWDSVYNFFVANYTDQTADFSRRTVRLPNSALIAALGYRRTKTIDLTAFRDVTSASARMWEVGKRLSFPPITLSYKTDLRFHALYEGSVVSITNSEYGIVAADFRITARTVEEIDKNLISFEAEQCLSTLFDGSFQMGGSGGTPYTPILPAPLVYQRVFELPAAFSTYTVPSFLVLGARAGAEEGFNVYISYDGGVGYASFQFASVWSQRGVLLNDYNSAAIDPIPINLQFYREDPIFASISAGEFAVSTRFALMGDELLRFQYVNPGTGANDLILTTIERGYGGTPVQTHLQDSEIWLFNLNDSIVLQNIVASNFYLKFVPVSGSVSADIALCTAIPVST